MPLTSPCFLNLFPHSIHSWFYSYLIYFPCLLLFLCLLGVNGLQGSVSWSFCFFTLHILLIQLFAANDSQIFISSQFSLLSPTDTSNHLLDFLYLFHTQLGSLFLSSVLPFHVCSSYGSPHFLLCVATPWCQCLYIIPLAPLIFSTLLGT